MEVEEVAAASFVTLPGDCQTLILDEATEGRYPLTRFKLLLAVSLVCRATRAQFESQWLQNTKRLEQLLQPIALGFPLPDGAFDLCWRLGEDLLHDRPPIRIACFTPLYYDTVLHLCPQLAKLGKLASTFRYKQVGQTPPLGVMQPCDYQTVKPQLLQLYANHHRLDRSEALAVLVDTQRLIHQSRHHNALTLRDAGECTQLRQVYLYVDKPPADAPKKCAPHPSGKDLRRLVALEDALAGGMTGKRLFALAPGALSGTIWRRPSLAHAWNERVREMKLYRRPLKHAAAVVKRRAKLAHKEERANRKFDRKTVVMLS